MNSKEIKIYVSNELFENMRTYLCNEHISYSEYIRTLIKKDLKRQQLKRMPSYTDKDVFWVFCD